MRLIILGFAICTLASCVWSTPSGIRELHRGFVGGITAGKASPDVDTAYHKTERHRENQWTIRMMPMSKGGEE